MNTESSSPIISSSQDPSSLMLPMRPEDPVTTTSTAADSSASYMSELVKGALEADNYRKRQAIQYTESLQLGKRKFHHTVDESASLSNFLNTTGGIRTTNDDEAGLSLLFAASLLQQGGHLTSTSMDSTANVVPSVVDAATTMNSYEASLDLSPSLPFAMSPLIASERPKKEFLEAAPASNMNGSIEPTYNDGRLQTIRSGMICFVQFVDSILSFTVLCGRGGGINKHYGNIVYRRVVEYNKKVYKQVPKRHRMLVSRSIVQAILNAGGRFLQEQSSNGATVWTEIPFRRAVQKTSQALRERSDDGTAAAGEEEPGDEVESNTSLPKNHLSSSRTSPSCALDGHSQPSSMENRRLEDVV